MPHLLDVRLGYLLRERVGGDGDHVGAGCALAVDGDTADLDIFHSAPENALR